MLELPKQMSNRTNKGCLLSDCLLLRVYTVWVLDPSSRRASGSNVGDWLPWQAPWKADPREIKHQVNSTTWAAAETNAHLWATKRGALCKKAVSVVCVAEGFSDAWCNRSAHHLIPGLQLKSQENLTGHQESTLKALFVSLRFTLMRRKKTRNWP